MGRTDCSRLHGEQFGGARREPAERRGQPAACDNGQQQPEAEKQQEGVIPPRRAATAALACQTTDTSCSSGTQYLTHWHVDPLPHPPLPTPFPSSSCPAATLQMTPLWCPTSTPTRCCTTCAPQQQQRAARARVCWWQGPRTAARARCAVACSTGRCAAATSPPSSTWTLVRRKCRDDCNRVDTAAVCNSSGSDSQALHQHHSSQ